MKFKFSNLLASLATVCALGFSAQAQEELPVIETSDPYHREFNLSEDKILLYDRNGHSSKDSTQIAPRLMPVHPAKITKPDTSKGSKDGNDDDALSFNFLYYMLQKFKLADLIDQ